MPIEKYKPEQIVGKLSPDRSAVEPRQNRAARLQRRWDHRSDLLPLA